MNKKISPVVMGDLVSSSGYENRVVLHKIFNEAVKQSNLKFKSDIVSPLTITLGDEFQGIVKTYDKAFEIIYFIKLALLEKKVDARFVLGATVISTKINRENAWNMMGEGLAEAREKLNNKGDLNSYRFSFPKNNREEELINAIGLTLTTIENEWTQTQLKYVTATERSKHLTKEEIAKKLKISKNTLYKVLRSAKYDFYSNQINVIMNYLRKLE